MATPNLEWFNLPNKLKKVLSNFLQASQAEAVSEMGATTNLTAIAGVYADLATARTSVNTLKTEVEVRLDNIEAKVDELISSLKAAGLIAE